MLRRWISTSSLIAACAGGLAGTPLARLDAAGDLTSRQAVSAEGADSAGSDYSAQADGDPADERPADAGPADDEEQPLRKTDRQWKRLLSPKQYRVTRRKKTETPFSGIYNHCQKDGIYRCVCCGAKLFASGTKFDSGTGWPSFFAPVRKTALAAAPDYSDGTPRIEVKCARCEAHLGHVFGDGPAPTGLRFCVNSAALQLEEAPSLSASQAHRAETSRHARRR